MLSKLSVKRPISITMVILIFIILGVVSFTRLNVDLFPNINIPIAAVSTTYFGASPEEVENIVTKGIESTLATVDNVKNITSISSEHNSLVIVEFTEATNMDSAVIDIREKLDMITGQYPDEVQAPMIIKFNPNMMPIMGFSITQEGKSMAEVTQLVEDVIQPRLESIEGVASVTISGGSEQEVFINIDSEKLELLNMDKEMISNLLMAQNLSLPAGTITDEGKDYSIRAASEFKSVDAIRSLVLFKMPLPVLPGGETMDIWEMLEQKNNSGALGTEGDSNANITDRMPNVETKPVEIKLEDIAEVELIEKNINSYSRVNGMDSVTITIQRQNEYNTANVAKKVNEEIKKITEDYDNAHITKILDQSDYINRMVDSVSRNAIIGAALAVFILLIFLKDLRPTIVIGAAIPISIIVSFTLIWATGITLNVISLGGLALGIGMLVDNAIVVLENIYRMRREGKGKMQAAIEGSRQVSGAITASTLTTISVFLPVIFVEGITAEIFKEMALTVSISLFASLLVALTLVPMLSSKLLVKQDTSRHHTFMRATRAGYRNLLKSALNHRFIVIIITAAVFVLSILGAASIGTEFMPTTDEGQLSITAKMPKGTTYSQTVKEVQKMEEQLMTLEEVETVSAQVNGGGGFAFFGGSADTGSITVLLVPKDVRDKSTNEVGDEIREILSTQFAGEVEVNAANSGMMMLSGDPISIEISGADLSVLEGIARDVADIVNSIEGTVEVDNGIEKGAPELLINMDRDLSTPLGVTTAQVAGTIREMLTGIYSTRLKVDGKEIGIKINETKYHDISKEDIVNLQLQSPMGQTVNLQDIAEVKDSVGYTKINRKNQKRLITVTSQLEEGFNVGEIGTTLSSQLDDYPVPEGYVIKITGENEQILESFESLGLALILAVVLVYMVMASQFESLLYPFVIMFSIPLAFTGGLLGLFLTNTPLSVVAFVGMIILSGIVVNNGIVLVDYINKLKEKGKSTKEAIIEAGPVRLRPILMTALTTILALGPMSLGLGEGAELEAPMAITVIGGLILSTVLTLLIVPVLYSLFDSIKERFGRRKRTTV